MGMVKKECLSNCEIKRRTPNNKDFENYIKQGEQLRILKNCIKDDELLKLDLQRILRAIEKEEEPANE